MEGFLIRGWEPILPGCGGTSTFSREATLAARWIHEPQPISNHKWGLGSQTLRGGIEPRISVFVPELMGLQRYVTISDPGI